MHPDQPDAEVGVSTMDAVQQTGVGVRTGSRSHVAKAAVAGVAMAAIVVGSIVAASVLSAGASGGARLADDHSYDAIENARGAIVVTGAAHDHSYDAIENIRGAID